NLHLEVTELTDALNMERTCGIWVTILGDLKGANAVSQVGRTILAEGFRVTRVDSIGDSGLKGVNVLARKIGSISRNEFNATREKLLALGSGLSVDLAVQRDD